MNLNQKQFSLFVALKVKDSETNQKEIAKKLNCTPGAISQALREKNKENSRYNGTRKDILKLFGYETENIINVWSDNGRIKL